MIEFYKKTRGLYEELNDYMHLKKDEVYYKLVEKIFDEISYIELQYEEKYLDTNFSLELKEKIVQYINPEDTELICQFVVNTKKRKKEINKEILKALDTLEEYQTEEYQCLYNNGFYDFKLDIEPIITDDKDDGMFEFEGEPLKERKEYSPYTYNKALIDYRKKFVSQLQNFKIKAYQGAILSIKNANKEIFIKEYIAEKIAKRLEKIAFL